ncbi:SH3 domain-containing protein [Paenibacillus polymyxa]|nr:SH3 domain-containing protein [Paenibacillus sp. PK1-4R]UOK64472.1 SH3 domain-containing protein [Paenibacillus sp. OVF10]WJM09234.1 SH3 domain-containing protein [Paenibacillus sp. PK1-4R]
MKGQKVFAILLGASVVLSGCGGIEITIKEEGKSQELQETTKPVVQSDVVQGGEQVELAVDSKSEAQTEVNKVQEDTAQGIAVEKPKEEASYAVAETSAEQSIDYLKPTSSEINLRVAPSINARSVGILYQDDEAVYLHRKNFDPSDGRTWYQVSISDGSIGWVSSKVVKQSDGRYYEGNAYSTSKAQFVTVSVAHANMRDIPSINGSAVAVVDKGDQLEHWGGSVYDPSDGRTWYEVWTSSGKYGWISGKVITW